MLRRTLIRSMLILSESDVKTCLDVRSALEAQRHALQAVSNGTADVPSRLGLQYYNDEQQSTGTAAAAAADFSLFKPAALQLASSDLSSTKRTDKMGIKIVSVRNENPTKGLPLVPATVLHINPETGIVDAVLAGTYLTGVRTAASPALAVQHTGRHIQHVVIFGAGLQAEQHVHTFCAALDCKLPKVTLINRSAPRAEQLAKQLQHEDRLVDDCHVVLLSDRDGVAQALSTADVISATTNTVTPLWDAEQSNSIPETCIITGIGSYTPQMQEVPAAAVDRCQQIWIDTPEAVTVGDLKHLQERKQDAVVHPMLLGDVLAQQQQQESTNIDCSKGLIFFKGVGTAIMDVLAADAVVQRARQLRIGTEVDMN